MNVQEEAFAKDTPKLTCSDFAMYQNKRKEFLKMLEPRKRTAIDGKIWWCVFDTETQQYNTILFYRYKRKYECQFAIDLWNIKKQELKEMIKGGA